MIWFDIKNLEEKLIKNEISERTGYHYLLAFLIIITLAISGKETADYFANFKVSGYNNWSNNNHLGYWKTI